METPKIEEIIGAGRFFEPPFHASRPVDSLESKAPMKTFVYDRQERPVCAIRGFRELLWSSEGVLGREASDEEVSLMQLAIGKHIAELLNRRWAAGE